MSDAAKDAAGWSPTQPVSLAGQRDAPTPAPAADTAAELNAARKRGYDEGYAKGMAAAQTQAAGIAGELRALLEAMASPFRDSEAVLLRELLDLTERICRAVIGRELAGGAGIEDVLANALAALGSSSVAVELTLHPLDAALLRKTGVLQDQTFTVRQSDAMQRGGVQLRAGASFVDASVEARLETALDALRAEAGIPADDPSSDGATAVPAKHDPAAPAVSGPGTD